MPVLALVSAKGSPGVTTAAAALTAAASLTGDSLLVELDPSGGDVQILTGVEDEPGVTLAATELRRQVSGGRRRRRTSRSTPPGVPALLAPTAELMAASVIASVIERWRPALREYGGTVVVDAGRWDGAQATARRVAVGDLVAVVCRPSVASVEHARHIVDRLRTTARRPVVALVIGTRPYAPSEVAAELEVPLGGAIAWDPRGVGTLWSKGVSKSWGRTWLASSAAQSLESLLDLVPDAIAQAPVSRTAGTGRRPLVAPGEAAAWRPPRRSTTSPRPPTTRNASSPTRRPPARPPPGTAGARGPTNRRPGRPTNPRPTTQGTARRRSPNPRVDPAGTPRPRPTPAQRPPRPPGGRATPPGRRLSRRRRPRRRRSPPTTWGSGRRSRPRPSPPTGHWRPRPARPTPPRHSPPGPRPHANARPPRPGRRPAEPCGRFRRPRRQIRPQGPPRPPTRRARWRWPTPGPGADAEADEGQEPQTSFERFTLGRARQRARHADRAIATVRLAGPETPGTAVQAEGVAPPADEADANDTSPDPTPDRGTGTKGAAQHSPPVRRGRRLNYGLARRDRS